MNSLKYNIIMNLQRGDFMKEINLKGEWSLKSYDHNKDNEIEIKGALPGCNYLDLMKADILADVFYGDNEYKSKWVAEKDWEYSRQFVVDEKTIDSDFVFLKISGADTLINIYINDNLVAKTQNAHINYEFNIKKYIKLGENEIRLYIYSPINYINQKQNEDKYPSNLMGISGFPHIRKPACHFGWDWGPVLPPSGVSGYIKIQAFNYGYIKDFTVNQRLITFDKAEIEVICDIVKKSANVEKYYLGVTVRDNKQNILLKKKDEIRESRSINIINIVNPELWEVNGASDRKIQPLYNIECQLICQDIVDEKKVEIGIREIELDTSEDEFGKQFAFVVNGKRIFAKGGNWIPADSFITRKTDEEIEYFIKSCVDANMNMIRVWGGGYYESDVFYRLCDKYGILVWQDFAFACQPYPFYNQEFLQNVKNEVSSVVKRLRNHTCLCLWCGNNEIESMTFSWFFKRKVIQWTKKFFYEILPQWLQEFNVNTPYWQSSPCGGEFLKKINSDKSGDTHLWHVWHGLMPFSYYRKRYTRFCSEFGFESLPDIDTVKTFADEKDFDLFSPALLSHQKCRSGNNKIIYYMIDNYCIPKSFKELIYVSQLVQAESIKSAVEHWRRNAGRCNGALYWQLNDCWPVLSWASMDYYGRWKALQYYAKRFFNSVSISLINYKHIIIIHMINDKDKAFDGILEWSITDFDGKVFKEGSSQMNIKENSFMITLVSTERKFFKGNKNNCLVCGRLLDKNNNVVSENTLFFNKINKLELKNAVFDKEITKIQDNQYQISLTSNTFAKNVFAHIKDLIMPLSENFFDLRAGEKKTITVQSDREIKESHIDIICYNNIIPKYTKKEEKRIKAKIAMQPVNFFSRILYKFM